MAAITWFFCRWRRNAEGEFQNAIQSGYPGMLFKFGEEGGADPITGAPVPDWTMVGLSSADALLVKNDLNLAKVPNPDMAKPINQLTSSEWAAFHVPVQEAGPDLTVFPGTATMGDVVNYLGRLINPAFDWHHYS
jgi:hypothetical protein